MPYTLLATRLPELARRETRMLVVPDGDPDGLPPDSYAFLEGFCDEPGCDCRRAVFFVRSVKRNRIEAVIGWGWEDRRFYVRWLGEDEPLLVDRLRGPSLELAASQGEYADLLLSILADGLSDPGFGELVRAHYAAFRRCIEAEAAQDCDRASDCGHDH
ncbi:MAG: hypothetical protein IT457_11130 [Planctomycetes bacterium]|nr:hypothetical protein [Planctomycetota bacterium]